MKEDAGEPRSHQANWDERHAARDPIESREPDPTLVAEAQDFAPGLALDVACGDGRNAIWLASRGWQVTAVDFSLVALESARRSAAGAGVEVDWRQEDLLAWAPPEGHFDLVTVLFLHLPAGERRGVYARAGAAVRPGGTLLVVGHDRTNLIDGQGGPQDPEVLFTAREIAAELAGFDVLRAEASRRPPGAPHGPLDAVVRATRLG